MKMVLLSSSRGCRWQVAVIAVPLLLLLTATESSALRCYQCGSYTDGVGSITPCINHTKELHLKECPKEKNKACLKYVSEGITVRECSAECIEKESAWGGYHYCCNTEGCNSSSSLSVRAWLVICGSLIAAFPFLVFPRRF